VNERSTTTLGPNLVISMPVRSRPHPDGSVPESRFDRRLGEILDYATEVFYQKGYEGASMRDLSRTSGMSLAGLYYYFENKEKLLYLIQKHTFSTVMHDLKERLENVSDPEQRVRIYIRNHLEYFLANLKAMKVLSHEDEALSGALAAEIADMKRDYYQLCRDIIDDLKRERQLPDRVSTRVAVLSLFGMMNWIYTWHDPRRDVQAADLADQMSEVFLGGLMSAARKSSKPGLVGSPKSQKATTRRQKTASSKV